MNTNTDIDVKIAVDNGVRFIANGDGTKTLISPTQKLGGTYVGLRLNADSKRRLSEILMTSGVENTIPIEDLHTTLVYSPSDLHGGDIQGIDPSRQYIGYMGEIIRLGNALAIKIVGDEHLRDRFEFHRNVNQLVHAHESPYPHISLKYYDGSEDEIHEQIGIDLPKLVKAQTIVNGLYGDPTGMVILTGEYAEPIRAD